MGGLDCCDRRSSSGLYCQNCHGCPRYGPRVLRHGGLAAGSDQIDRADLALIDLAAGRDQIDGADLGLTGLAPECGLTGRDLTGLAAELFLFCPECGLAFQWRY